MQHHRPHPKAKFEGFYSKFDLPSGQLVLVLCTVRQANSHVLILTYVSSNGHTHQTELWPRDFTMASTGPKSFTLTASDPDQGIQANMDVTQDTTTYSVDVKNTVTFTATTSSRTSWSPSTPAIFNTPAHLLALLPLPLHWHVHSLASPATFSLSYPGAHIPAEDESGPATVHEEKNWAHGFPSAHIWLQARRPDGSSGICLAGGRTLGVDAFLLGYRNRAKDVAWDFRPPVAMTLPLLGWSPFMVFETDWPRRWFHLSVQDWWWRGRKVVVSAQAPKGSFFTLSSPHPGGFRAHWMAESLSARIEVEVLRRKRSRWWQLWGRWEVEWCEVFQKGGLEFGGEYYPLRGREEQEKTR